MSRHPVERHNEEFKMLFERHVASLEAGEEAQPKEKAKQLAAEMLGVKPETIHAYRRPEGSKTAYACAQWRVDMYRLALPPEISRINDNTREQLLTKLTALRGAGVMSEPTAKAFDRLARKARRA